MSLPPAFPSTIPMAVNSSTFSGALPCVETPTVSEAPGAMDGAPLHSTLPPPALTAHAAPVGTNEFTRTRFVKGTNEPFTLAAGVKWTSGLSIGTEPVLVAIIVHAHGTPDAQEGETGVSSTLIPE